jgi:hypothetical protein
MKMKNISFAECADFKQHRDDLECEKFHAIQSSIDIQRWWQVSFKTVDGKLTTIKSGLSVRTAKNLAKELNEKL